jgi:hypothetical protein
MPVLSLREDGGLGHRQVVLLQQATLFSFDLAGSDGGAVIDLHLQLLKPSRLPHRVVR